MILSSKLWHMIQCKFLPFLKFCKRSALFLIPMELQFGGWLTLINNPCMPNISSIHSSYLHVLFFKVSDQNATLWRKYLHRVSKWDETFPSSQVSQIISLHQNSVHFIELCEHRSNSCFLSKFSVCEASISYLAPLWLKIFLSLLLSI